MRIAPSCSPKRYASPSPAARPASAPSHGLIGRFAAAAAAGVVAGAAGACCAAGGVAGLSGTASRRAPIGLPPPRRRASASSITTLAVRNAANKVNSQRFIASSTGASSVFSAAVQRHNARGKVEVFDVLQSGSFHQQPQRLLVGVHADRLGEVPVARLVLGDPPAEPG